MAAEFTDNWTTQLRKGLLELAILNALRGSRLYGYQIVRQLQEIEGLVISEGTIYPLLNRLRKEALVHTTLEQSPEGPARKYYELTRLGLDQLRWMNGYWDRLTNGLDSLRGGRKR